jgi:hypothetical protein
MPPGIHPDNKTVEDVSRCIGFLTDLESRWSGASRSKAIIERLLAGRQEQITVADAIVPELPGAVVPNPATGGLMGSSVEAPMAPPRMSRNTLNRHNHLSEMVAGGGINDPSHKRSFAAAFPTGDLEDGGVARSAEDEVSQQEEQDGAVWNDVFWSELISLDDMSVALLNESWRDDV